MKDGVTSDIDGAPPPSPPPPPPTPPTHPGHPATTFYPSSTEAASASAVI